MKRLLENETEQDEGEGENNVSFLQAYTDPRYRFASWNAVILALAH